MTFTMDAPGRPKPRRSPAGPDRAKLPKLPRDRKVRGHGSSIFRRVLITASILLLVGVITAIVVFVYAWNNIALPADKTLTQTTFLTDASGAQLASWNAGENRVEVDLNDVPPVVRQAILDTEDHSYYSHKGVDPRGLGRAFWTDLRSGDKTQGGSTLTQQYVKTVYLTSERSFVRKFKEAILAMKLEQQYSKDEIFERYLNTIYFGRGTYGVQAASRAYFDKDVGELGLPEASYLAAIIRSPEHSDAYKDTDLATQRRNLTLGSMVKYGSITPEEQATVSALDIKSYVKERAAQSQNVASSDKGTEYFVSFVKDALEAKYGEELVEGGGLRVKTTLDLNSQAKAYDSVYGFLKENEPAGALVSVDQSGAIKAMVGGRNWQDSNVNLATGRLGGGSGRQAGSTFKPFALAAAVQDGMCFKETYAGPPKLSLKLSNKTTWDVSNFGNESFGNIDLITATEHSVNTVYAQLAQDITSERIATMAKSAGVESPLNKDALSIVLGADSVSPLEMADAYLTFALNGQHIDPNPILEVKTADGKDLNWELPKKQRVMSEQTAKVVNQALQAVVKGGTGRSAAVGKPLAGKTGTTTDHGDAWFVGYTPTLSTAVWMGYPEGATHRMNNVRGISVTGGTFPAQMFSTYMKYATKNAPATVFDAPKNCTPTKSRNDADVDESSAGSTTTTTSTTVPDEDGLIDLNPFGQRAGRSRDGGLLGGDNSNSSGNGNSGNGNADDSVDGAADNSDSGSDGSTTDGLSDVTGDVSR